MKVEFKVPYFNNFLTYRGHVTKQIGIYSIVEYLNNNQVKTTTTISTDTLTFL